tara:strand:+ start:370 stop:843 length:474 start_codon:yes stop_codon:yes gene_type:complete
MASELRVDKIHNEGGDNDSGIDLSTNDQIVLKTANTTRLTMNATGQTTIVGEGGSTTTSLQQGLAKVWCNHNTTPSIQDSFNVSGVTDEGTGSFDTDFTNAMSNSTYSALCGAFGTSQQTFGVIRDSSTTSYRCNTYGDDGSAEDRDLANSAHGDLA